jgi:hypothetical protein
MVMTLSEKLTTIGIDVNDVPPPGGSYVPLNIRDTNCTVAIQLPIEQGQFLYRGVLGRDMPTKEGYKAARLAAINVLRQVQKYVPEGALVGMNHVDIMYQCEADWEDGPTVANGASDLFLEVLGEQGKHTRSIVGVYKLPRNFCVALVASFTVKANTVVKS